MASVTVRVSGPIFSGKAAREVTSFLTEARHDVSQQGYSDWMTNLNESIRWPTPYYELQINVRHEGNQDVINDRGVIYGWWLERGATNNESVHFKGYHSRQRAGNTLGREATGLAERTLEKYVRRMQ